MYIYNYYSKQGEKIVVLVLVRIIIMSKSGFEDEVFIKLIVKVVKHVTCHHYYYYYYYYVHMMYSCSRILLLLY
jgi:hypothetical protein